MKYLGNPQSGSQAATVASRNRYGQYYRTRATPTQPRSVSQVGNRNIFGALSQSWRDLSLTAQDAWRSWALTHPRVDPLGSSIVLTGTQAFISVNQWLVRCFSLGAVSAPPPDVGPGANFVTGITMDASARTAVIAHEATTADDLFSVYAGPPRSAGTAFEGDYRFIIALSDVNAAGNLAAGTEYESVWGNITSTTGKVVNWRVTDGNITGLRFTPYDFRVTVAA